jgi:hypothetical protein
MPSFDAGEVLESLDWDFTRAGVKAKGVVPEPSDHLIGAFLDGLKKLYTDAKASGLDLDLPEGATPEQMMDALNQVTVEKFEQFMAKTAELFADLCSGKPSKEQLLALPLRVRVKFYGWVQAEVVRPEAGTGAGNVVEISPRSAAAG